MKEPKSTKKPKLFHTPAKSKNLGTYQGMGIKNKVGRMIDGFGVKPVSAKGLKKPPKTLA